MAINISIPDVGPNLRPQITVLGVGGSGGNAVNNMINSNLEGVDFVIANTDAQALQSSNCKKKIQLGIQSTRGLGAGMRPDIGKQAAEETLNEISEMLEGSHMLFIAAGMGGGTGTGAAPVIAKLAREKGVLTVGVVTKPFHFEGTQRMKLADKGLDELQQYVDTLLTIPNQNLFRIANEKTTFADAFKMADDVLYAGVRGVTDLMVQPGLINLDFSDVKTVMSEMGKAMMGTGEASGEGRAVAAAEAAIANPLIDDVSLKGAKGLIINITGGNDITLYEVDEAANRIKQEVDENANIIYGTTCDDRLEGVVRVSIVATGIDANSIKVSQTMESAPPLAIDNSVYLKETNNFEESAIQSLDHSIEKENEIKESFNTDIVNDDFSPEANDKVSGEKLENSINLNDQNIESEDSYAEDLDIPEKNNNNELLNNQISSEMLENDLSLENFSEQDEEKVGQNLVEEDKEKASVRRLSLFDSLESKNQETVEYANNKNEPIFQDSENAEEAENTSITSEESENTSITTEDEFSGEESDIDEEVNQDSEEELLDIPTFLRRQAN